MITIKPMSIKAACGIAATKDIRHYLNGVQILVRDNGDVHVRATDGHVVFDDLMPEKSASAPVDFIIPLDIAKLIAKSTARTAEIIKTSDDRFECLGSIFKPIDGKFPDLDRIIHSRDSQFDNTVAHYDALLLARCQTAMRIATGSKNGFYRVQNSERGLMYRENATFPRCVIMPLRDAAFVSN